MTEGEELRKLVVNQLKRAVAARGQDASKFDASEIVSARNVTVSLLVTDPKTLLPRHAIQEKRVEIASKTKGTRTQVDRKEYWIDGK